MPIARQTALPAGILNTEGSLHSTMKNGESDENESESEIMGTLEDAKRVIANNAVWCLGLEDRIIALERGIEAVLRRLEESGQAEDEAGWFGRPE